MNDIALGKNIFKLIKAAELMTNDNGATINELELALNMKRRSVYRLIKILEDELHFPVAAKRESFGGLVKYRLPGNYLTRLNKMAAPRISLSNNEVMLLQFLLAHDMIFQGTQIYKNVQLLKKKINNFLPKKKKDKSSNLIDNNIFIIPQNSLKSYKGKENIIYTLIEALFSTKPCSITYNAFKKRTTKAYTIHPLKFIHHRGGLYLLHTEIMFKEPKHLLFFSLMKPML
jgi:predicted DNA-binding transcriptional regulator YafY